jgi:hypothetical protein
MKFRGKELACHIDYVTNGKDSQYGIDESLKRKIDGEKNYMAWFCIFALLATLALSAYLMVKEERKFELLEIKYEQAK